MEFVDGETLETFIRRCGRLEIELALEIVAQVTAGLSAIHHTASRSFESSSAEDYT
jgi:serine/threonine protein kinase